MLEVNEETLNQFRRDLQQMKSQLLEHSAKQTKLEAELREIRVMIEDRQQH